MSRVSETILSVKFLALTDIKKLIGKVYFF